jgi:uncharacterized membrane protein YhaH (DUF805 family)
LDDAAIHPDRLNSLSYWAFNLTLLVIIIIVAMIIFFVSLQISYFFHNFATVINLFAAIYLSEFVISLKLDVDFQ